MLYCNDTSEGRIRVDAHVSKMVRAVEAAKTPSQQSELLRRCGKDLLARPEMCAELIKEAKTGPLSDARMSVLIAALDGARMADENAQRTGRAFLDNMRDVVAELDNDLTAQAALSLSSAWTRAGLTPPTSLAHAVIPEDPDAFADTDGIPDIPDEMFDGIFNGFNEIGEQSVSAMLAMLDEMLPTLPSEARFAFIRKLATRSEPLCGEAAAALLLATDPTVRAGALAGLALREEAGDLSQALFSRITLIRSWLQDEGSLCGIDEIIRSALKSGTQAPQTRSKPKIHRVVSSMIDGSGAQSISMAIQSGSRRALVVVLLKQGFGIKDAFVIPCSSATEQKQMIGQIMDEAGAVDTTADYAFAALSWALANGQAMGTMPAAGLLDVVETSGFGHLRPQTADIADIASAADPEGMVSALSARARGSLIMASEDWPDRFPISDSWFEDSDASSDAIESATTQNSMNRKLWQHLETRRDFWAMVFARNAALLAAAKDPTASEFVAVAQAMTEGRDLKKTPVMHFIHGMSFDAWVHQEGSPMSSGGLEVTEERLPPGTYAEVGSFGAKEQKALDKLLRPAKITLPWMEGFLTGLCTAPKFIKPSDWIVTIFDVVAEDLTSEDDLQKLLDLVVLAYHHRLSLLRNGAPSEVLFPGDPILFSIWADGYLTAWEAHKPHWPTKSLGKEGKAMRALLEQAADFKTKTDQAPTLRNWLIARAENQK
jgi:yecA family protein